MDPLIFQYICQPVCIHHVLSLIIVPYSVGPPYTLLTIYSTVEKKASCCRLFPGSFRWLNVSLAHSWWLHVKNDYSFLLTLVRPPYCCDKGVAYSGDQLLHENLTWSIVVCSIRVTRQLEGWKETNYWNQVEQIEDLQLYLDFQTLGLVGNAPADFIIVSGHLISEVLGFTARLFLEQIANGVHRRQLLDAAASASLIRIHLQFSGHSGVYYSTMAAMSLMHRTVTFLQLWFQ